MTNCAGCFFLTDPREPSHVLFLKHSFHLC